MISKLTSLVFVPEWSTSWGWANNGMKINVRHGLKGLTGPHLQGACRLMGVFGISMQVLCKYEVIP